MDQLLKDVRYEMCSRAIRFINYELVPGDILEFGVYSGRSLSMFAHAHEQYLSKVIHKCDLPRKIIGLDSFQGLPIDTDAHPRWSKGMFAKNHSAHPTIGQGEPVTPDAVCTFFSKIGLDKPHVISGEYSSPEVRSQLSAISKAIALVHIDCDLYESTLVALQLVEDMLQEGCIMMFDDWFNYKADSSKGEQKAVNQWLQASKWELMPYHPYGTFCMSFIVRPRKSST
jgi:O-methyltransferase